MGANQALPCYARFSPIYLGLFNKGTTSLCFIFEDHKNLYQLYILSLVHCPSNIELPTSNFEFDAFILPLCSFQRAVKDMLGFGPSNACFQTLRSVWQRPTLPGPCGPSTIGAEGLNFRVRNGNGWDPLAIVTNYVRLSLNFA